jgi:hypothetical protein
MKKISLLILVCFILNASFGQMNQSMDLSNLINNASSLHDFVNDRFHSGSFDRHKLIDEAHPLLLNEVNQVINDSSIDYSFFGLNVNELYAFVKNDSNTAVYILLDLDLNKIKMLVKSLGNPENLESADVLDTGEFSFLTWKLGSLRIWLQNDSVSNKKQIVRSKSLITITNMNYGDLINMEKI